MKFIRISPMEIVNMEAITRINVNEMHDVIYTTLHFQGGESYRCTEEESVIVMKYMHIVSEKPD